jgi:hypothetical protein
LLITPKTADRAEENEAHPGQGKSRASLAMRTPGLLFAAFLHYRNDSTATAGHIHTPCLIMLDQASHVELSKMNSRCDDSYDR